MIGSAIQILPIEGNNPGTYWTYHLYKLFYTDSNLSLNILTDRKSSENNREMCFNRITILVVNRPGSADPI